MTVSVGYNNYLLFCTFYSTFEQVLQLIACHNIAEILLKLELAPIHQSIQLINRLHHHRQWSLYKQNSEWTTILYKLIIKLICVSDIFPNVTSLSDYPNKNSWSNRCLFLFFHSFTIIKFSVFVNCIATVMGFCLLNLTVF